MHAPPGGRSNINIFGGGEEPVQQKVQWPSMGQSSSQQKLGSSYQVGQSYGVNQGFANPSAFEQRDMNKAS